MDFKLSHTIIVKDNRSVIANIKEDLDNMTHVSVTNVEKN